jgi:flagellin
MSLDSINTNVGAMIALESLNTTQSQLAATQKQISTGYRVSDSTDDGAAYAIAQSVRSTVGSLTTANTQLGSVQGLLSTTQTSLNNISNTMASMRDVLVQLSGQSVVGNARTNYETQFKSLVAQVQTFIQDANYDGQSLIGNISNSGGTFGRVSVARNDLGASYGIATYGGSTLYATLTSATSQLSSSTTVRALITATGSFITEQGKVGVALNTVGSEINYVANQISYNNDKIDALNSGLGALVDADLAKESAQLTSLQIRQQLGTQSLSLANSAPQTLLSLFK